MFKHLHSSLNLAFTSLKVTIEENKSRLFKFEFQCNRTFIELSLANFDLGQLDFFDLIWCFSRSEKQNRHSIHYFGFEARVVFLKYTENWVPDYLAPT